jgi:nitronate monooxygenase
VQIAQIKRKLPSTPYTLPVGVGFINWGASLDDALSVLGKYRPAAVWFFAPKDLKSLESWTSSVRKASPETKIWIQIGSVNEALTALQVKPDVIVVQGTDAGGHGLARGASLVTLLPEVDDAVTAFYQKEGGSKPILLGAGGVTESRGAAAAFALGASGVVLGTRLLASKEANIAKGYQDEVLRASDGGQTTVRTKVYDNLRGTTGWAETHNARGIINKSFTDAIEGMPDEENKRLYEEETKKGDSGWGIENRMTTYAGSGVGLIKEVKGAAEIVNEVRDGVGKVFGRLR